MVLKDARVAEEIRKKNEAAVSEVMDRYSRLLWSVAAAVLRGAGTAADVEVFRNY